MTALTVASAAPHVLHRSAPRVRVFGLDATELHDLYWSARGIQVIRNGTAPAVDPAADAYLLLDTDTLILFDPPARRRRPARRRTATWMQVVERDPSECAEEVHWSADGRVVRMERRYRPGTAREAMALLTADRRLAGTWGEAPDARSARADVRVALGHRRPERMQRRDGLVFKASDAEDARRLCVALVRSTDLSRVVDGDVRRVGPEGLAHRTASVSSRARLVGPAWIGAGRVVRDGDVVAGPCVLPDVLERRDDAIVAVIREALAPVRHSRREGAATRLSAIAGRALNLTFSLVALLLTAPLYPPIMFLIWLEDGRPFFFGHQRQARGGRTFRCIKFRTMCRDAERLKAKLRRDNAADGPQFHMPDDPRLLKVGRWLRRLHLDELPQFLNVLRGEMNVVGPRPSPDAENQCCPAWRETRLSVRPGITGLWQVCRTRRPNIDFQEWIRYDMEYVRRRSLRLDAWIVWRTLRKLMSWREIGHAGRSTIPPKG